jgi:hypothetical protein
MQERSYAFESRSILGMAFFMAEALVKGILLQAEMETGYK